MAEIWNGVKYAKPGRKPAVYSGELACAVNALFMEITMTDKREQLTLQSGKRSSDLLCGLLGSGLCIVVRDGIGLSQEQGGKMLIPYCFITSHMENKT